MQGPEKLIDAAYVRNGINVPPNTTDERIEQLIEEAELTIREYCHNPYMDGLPQSYKRNIVKIVEFDLNRKSGLTSEGLARHSQGFATDYPDDMYKGLKRRLSW
ncbi:hypothetical protein BTR22_18640 [Alkalihalophilus pseudofirmus]|uniref:phage head-tail connector protein n=1 Tax=Alkalihalophilus pseudofirmus TaxID=79885 RepID=UPI0009511BD3|nr:hypothetical protein BTR22_18640 [Alkalihalophilus pseudofirmus]